MKSAEQRKGRVIAITGASAGVGRATVRRFAREGETIALLARGVDGLEAARREVEDLGGRALVLPTDMSDPEQVEAAAERIERELGPIDVWINNAMCSVFSPVKEMSVSDYRRVTDVTYLGYVWGTLAALRRMLPRDQGLIIQVGSALAYRSIPLQSAYCAAKHAVIGFTESLRTELIHDQSSVKVTMVQLPAVNTPQFGWVKSRLKNKAMPVPPIYEPEVIAEGIYFVSRHPRRELDIGFSTLKAILAEKLAPGFADHYLARTGYRSQQTDEPEDPTRPNNLWEPVPGDHGAHGSFDSLARNSSPELWLSMNRNFLLAGLALVGGMLVASRAPVRRLVPKLREAA